MWNQLNRLTVVVALIGSLLAGCDNTGVAPVAPTTRAADTSDQPTTKPINKRFVFIPKNAGNAYFDSLSEGIRRAADDQGASYTLRAPATGEPASQVPLIEDELGKGMQVLLIAPNSADALTDVLKRVKAKGVTIVTVDSDLTGHEDLRTASVLAAQPSIIGQTQIELMASLIGNKGKFVILSATAEAPNQNSWIAAMKEALAKPQYKDMELVDVVYGNDDHAQSIAACEKLLSKYPDLKGILSPTTIGIAAAAEVIAQQGKSESIKLTGLGLPSEMRPFIKDGTVQACSLWTPYDMGYLAGYTGGRIAAGQIKPSAGMKLDVDRMGNRTFDEKSTLYMGFVVTFNATNIDLYRF
jgi:rhamnose transport system substrate-binding protein